MPLTFPGSAGMVVDMIAEYPFYIGLDKDNRHGDPTLEIWEISEGVVLNGVHSKTRCGGKTCVLHHPTGHSMREWTLHWRDDRGIFERICEHGIGHPDPDQYDYMLQSFGKQHADAEMVHGCDGCCRGAYGEVQEETSEVADYMKVMAAETIAAKAEEDLVHYKLEYLLRRLNRAAGMDFKVTLDEWEVAIVAKLIDASLD